MAYISAAGVAAALVLVGGLLLTPRPAYGQPERAAEDRASTANAGASKEAETPRERAKKKTVDPERREFGVLPAVASSSDFGVGGGVLGHVTKFSKGYYPYRWRVAGIVFVAGQRFPNSGVELSLQFHRLELDFPGFGHKRVRLSLIAQYYDQPNSGYYGIGNRTGVDEEARARDHRYYQYAISGGLVQPSVRVQLTRRLHGWFKGEVSYRTPSLHPGSKLEQDRRDMELDSERGRLLRGLLNGLDPHWLTVAQAGIFYDTRDHEFAPQNGMYHELSGRAGRLDSGPFTGISATARFYKSLWQPYVVMALRLALDRNYGTAPLSRMSSINGLALYSGPGGAFAVRGVPEGRYHGLLKVLANLELRTSFLPVTLWKQRFRLGAIGFVDAGRVWADPGRADELDRAPLPVDGLRRSPALKYGLGGGLRVRWGDTFIVRADLGVSPDGVGYILVVNHHF